MTDTSSSSTPSAPIWTYVWLGLIAHIIWGSYPVFAKRAVQEVPKFSLLIFAWLAALLVGALLIRWRDRLTLSQALAILKKTRSLWALALFVVLRSVSNIIAIDLTRATWVQLIYLLTPFVVALLGVTFFAEPVPRFTFRALFVSTFGTVLVLIQDWTQLSANFTPQDILGLVTAFLSMFALAMYFQLVRRSQQRQATSGIVLFQQGAAALPVFIILSISTGEDWSQWSSLSPGGWWTVLAVIWLVMVVANFIQIVALGSVNPALITNLMPLRLVSTLFLGWMLLGEQLTTIWQWLGVILVITTVSAYLWLQRPQHPHPSHTQPKGPLEGGASQPRYK